MLPELNTWFFAALAIVAGFYLLELASNLLNLRHLQPDPPEGFDDVYDPAEYSRSQVYTRESTRFGAIQSTLFLLVFLGFWFAGGFGWLDHAIRSLSLGPIASGLLALSVLYLASHLLSLPFSVYDTFVIEAKYGFNRTSPKTFVSDLLKGLLLLALLGLPILAVILWFFETGGPWAWVQAWITVASLSVVLTWLAPRLIFPLFLRFSPLEAGPLREAIEDMARRCRFPIRELFVVDGSRRSSKANAFFTGFGRNKKIALYDTLIENHETDELVAVLAHEIGHFKRRHILQQMTFAVLQMGILFFLLALVLRNPGLSRAFGVAEPSVSFSLVFFSILYKPVNHLLGMAASILSRRHEFEADAYAAQSTGNPESLMRALKKLSRNNLSNLTPHPLFVFLNYSHPPLIDRVQALQGGSPGPA